MSRGRHADPETLFKTSNDCMACHNSLRTPSGEDVSIGSAWRASMMANSSRDPYWQASVRREVLDHPRAAAAIQDECAVCHMPMAQTAARAAGEQVDVFSHLPAGPSTKIEDLLAHDGVSCTLCHQITGERLGTPESFTGGYVVPLQPPSRSVAAPSIFGPFRIEGGLDKVMHSATGFKPTEASHIRQSELCATCHTLITKALGPGGETIGELPEQMTYLEWRHSAFAQEQKSCQSCHMPVVEVDTPIASVLGKPRPGFARHAFVGGNAFMLRMLNRYRDDLGVVALPGELETSAERTVASLQSETAKVTAACRDVGDRRLTVDVTVQNLTGHKLPTGYPARRAWLHFTVKSRDGLLLFESGASNDQGMIEGSRADIDSSGFEPHYAQIQSRDQVQIYESVMRDSQGRATTGLLQAVGYLKDNRLLPRGFEKGSADAATAVIGDAAQDTDFAGGEDRVRYSVDTAGYPGPYQVSVALRFQSIGFRWAENLKAYDAPEPQRFSRYYAEMASMSSETLSSFSGLACHAPRPARRP